MSVTTISSRACATRFLQANNMKHRLDVQGSSTGNSHYEALLECPRRARLSREKKAQSNTIHLTGTGTAVGTIGHGFMELYYGGKIRSPNELNNIEFEPKGDFDLVIDPATRSEATRLMGEYMTRFSPTSFGEVLFLERLMPKTDKEAEVVQAAVGIAPWTGRLDMGVRLTKKVAEALQLGFGLDVRPQKKYIVDFKFVKAEAATLKEQYVLSLQAMTYQMAMNAIEVAAGREPFAGMIFDVIIKTKEPKFRRYLAPAPADPERAIVAERWRAVEVMAKNLDDWANTKACIPWFGEPCRFYTDSTCDRGVGDGLVRIGEMG